MIPRFDALTRIVHWVTTALTAALVGTGTVLYVGQLSAVVGRRALLARIHVWSGILLLVPLVAGVALRQRGRGLRSDVVELGRWSDGDRRWLRRRTRIAPSGKFNGGQKLAAALFAGLFAMQLVTGSLMHWNQPFSDEWRTGATFVHDWAYLALLVLIAGHIRYALREPDLLRAMRTGSVTRSWAERERPAWARRSG
ncbi:MAG TPA: cytochrome b/b6 domain-containing protein [Acidimicrobiales bacterium]|nr:cytochrome b/b6 domain-containing protein [Acidimicrobiales bacterium]